MTNVMAVILYREYDGLRWSKQLTSFADVTGFAASAAQSCPPKIGGLEWRPARGHRQHEPCQPRAITTGTERSAAVNKGQRRGPLTSANADQRRSDGRDQQA